MAVYTIEIPNGSPREYKPEDVARIIKAAFEYTNVRVDLKHRGSLKDLASQEEYNAYMGAG